MHDDVTYRRARQNEGSAVADVWLRSRAASHPDIPAPVHDADEVRRWFSDVVVPNFETWVVETSEGQIVGLLVLKDAWLDQLYLEPGWTGLGIGSCLVNLAKSRRPDRLDLWVFQSNVRARRFYEEHGFVLVETTEGENEESAPDAHYAWQPQPPPSAAGPRFGHRS